MPSTDSNCKFITDHNGKQLFEPADTHLRGDILNGMFNEYMSDALSRDLSLGAVRRAMKAVTLRKDRVNLSHMKKLVQEHDVQCKRNFERGSKLFTDFNFLDFNFLETPLVP